MHGAGLEAHWKLKRTSHPSMEPGWKPCYRARDNALARSWYMNRAPELAKPLQLIYENKQQTSTDHPAQALNRAEKTVKIL